ncbi:MAG: GNAT family N-acetyltransferase [Thermoguttaceae bacterium]
MRVELRDEASIDAALDAQLKQFLADTFPAWADIFRSQRVWHRTPPLYTVIAWDADCVIGHVAVVSRVITTTWNWRYRVASVQGVSVTESARHRGLGKTLLARAIDEARTRGFAFAILYCQESLVPYYQRLGWTLADDSMIMRNSRDQPIAMRSNCPMYFTLAETQFPEGPIDIHSPDDGTKPDTKSACLAF